MVDDQIGYAVGPQGLLLKTDNGGAAWRRLRLKSLDDETSLKTDSLSFSRVTVAKGFAWLSVQNRQSLIRVNLSDRTVTSITLPTNATVHQVVFADPTHAFAVGEFGTILASSDGGQTWKRQRGTHDRVGLLLVARTAQQVPLGMLAIHAGEESRICGTVLLSDSANQDAHTSTAAARHAFERVGSTVNLGADVLATGGSSVETLAEVIQRLRPSAVVCCEEPLAGNQLATITDAAVKRAAADADSQPAWQVERMITASVAGSVQIDHRRMLPSLGKTVGDAIAISRAILGQSLRGSRPSSWAIRDLATPRRIVGSDLMSGLGQNGNAIPLREQRTALGNLNAMKQSLALQKKRNDYAQLDVKSDQDRIAWQQQVLATALPMDSDEAGLWLADLAEQTLLTGQLIKTANTLRLLATRWPNHGLAPAINAWLSAYGSSSEAAATQLARAGDERPETDQTDRLRQAAVHLGQIGRGDPALALSPAVRWLEFRLLAQSSDRAAVESRLKKLAGGRSGEALLFAAAARAELDGLNGLEKSADVRSSNAMRCVYARERPYLDGALNDAVWQAARKGGAVENYQLASATQPDEVYFARDDKFFYAAYKCQKIAGKTYRSSTAPRPRDPDLSRRDRVQLQIDTDRDFCSTLTLEVDHRGWAADSALGNSYWNPQWFVAQASDDQTWTIEFAIPLDEFVAIKPTDFDRWAIRLDRLATGRQSLWHERTNSQIDAQSGLQAAMLPDPRGFQILAIEGDSAGSNQRQLTARRTDSHYDRQVKPAQFQLELEPLPKLQQAPEIPQLGNLP